jgi:hypothetical protein
VGQPDVLQITAGDAVILHRRRLVGSGVTQCFSVQQRQCASHGSTAMQAAAQSPATHAATLLTGHMAHRDLQDTRLTRATKATTPSVQFIALEVCLPTHCAKASKSARAMGGVLSRKSMSSSSGSASTMRQSLITPLLFLQAAQDGNSVYTSDYSCNTDWLAPLHVLQSSSCGSAPLTHMPMKSGNHTLPTATYTAMHQPLDVSDL